MKKFLNIRLLLVISLLISSLLAVSATPLFAEEEKPTADFSVSALTKYVWRGQELSRDSIVLQPSLTVGYKGFSANLWGNLDTKPYKYDKLLVIPLIGRKRMLRWVTAGLSGR